jgi:diacylglycerol kinase (ATP)
MEDDEYSIVFVPPTIPVILFANPKSGSNLAQEYLKLNKEEVKFDTSQAVVNLYIFNLIDEKNRLAGCSKAKELISATKPLRVMIAGGDGSLIWVIETFISEDIPLKKIMFGILPFGSGNDLSAMLGWGRDPPSDLFEPFISSWLAATPHNFDFWLIKAETEESGGFGRVNKSSKSYTKTHIKEGGSTKVHFERLMSNYFSIGLDARIGLGFDKHRTTKKCCNKLVYAWEGFKKLCCCLKTPRVPELVDNITEFDNKVIVDNSNPNLALPKDTSVLLALNIRTYAGGDNYVWEKARTGPGKQWVKQSANDGNLEIMTFVGKIGLGLEQIKCTQGQARKLYQGTGPYFINFSQTSNKCYMQIDGEYYYVEKPKYISVELWERSKEIKVLFRTSQ